ncbi:hypothetical protein [Oceanobacillus alkalisoli]|uniref:hypothetical protein n=1 Tax=Oceanobacillus alkalisoli TaxID=2925113 RepID=UPI001EE40A75|nr:hypothetical protein [Oceanobacillus alkalisoli]MCG5103242.1 hypothetical protein [Oceanobacillus alkalisoli]
MHQIKKETVIHEDVDALNEYDGEVIDVNKAGEIFDLSINVHNYYVTDTHVRVMAT